MCLLLMSVFLLDTLRYRPDWYSATEIVVILEGSALPREDRWSSDREFRWASSPRKIPAGSELLPFTDDFQVVIMGSCV